MTEPNELTYAAIITLTLPGMEQPATVTVSLTPPSMVRTAAGESKPLRDCTLAELKEFADALEAELWARYRENSLGDLAGTDDTRIKITLLDENGSSRELAPEAWLKEAIVLAQPEAPASMETEENVLPGDEAAASGEGDIGSGEAASTEAEAESAEDVSTATADGAEETEETGAAPAAVEEIPEAEAQREAAQREAAQPDAAQPDVAPATAAEAVGGVVAPPPEETPVVSGTAPTTAPAGMETPDAVPQIRIAGLRRPVGHPTPAAVDILINEPVFRNTQAHALTSLNREVAGMLVGPQPEKQPDGRYVVHVTDAIIARHTRMHGASVTYTPESWRYVTDVVRERYPHEEAIIVGWYHTHPGFGIFLSGMDLFIHQNFFTQKWHIALVLDPLAHKSGFFCWDRGQHAVQAYDFPWPPWAAGSW